MQEVNSNDNKHILKHVSKLQLIELFFHRKKYIQPFSTDFQNLFQLIIRYFRYFLNKFSIREKNARF